ncbi:MAG: hypothetical protein ACE5F1_03315 [Planctomycetota bacterium]
MSSWLPCLLWVLAFLPQDRLASARAARLRGDYQTARRHYGELLGEGSDADGRLEYNLGNCEYRLGNFARALWRYEQARRQLGDREELVFNRSLALRRLGIDTGEGEGLLESVRQSLSELGGGTWFWIGLGLDALALCLLWRGLVGGGRTRVLLALLLLLPAGYTLLHSLGIDEKAPRGVVILEDQTDLRAEPRAELPALRVLNAGLRARYVSGTPDWLRIRVGEREGWVPRERAGVY